MAAFTASAPPGSSRAPWPPWKCPWASGRIRTRAPASCREDARCDERAGLWSYRAVDARPDAVADVLRKRRVREQHVDLREGCALRAAFAGGRKGLRRAAGAPLRLQGSPSSAARAGNRRFGLPSAPCTHTKAAYKLDLLCKMQRALNRPRPDRTVAWARKAWFAELPAADHGLPRVRSHCRFINRGTDPLSKSGIKWMSGSTKRQCDRALGLPHTPRARPGPSSSVAPESSR